ncbi:hypothetical protein QLQ15_14430 [Lysobacter sp. LF1]|uniref:Uncharacterized protein n=1 Tax=Lysobacter stagni TaxID=3045172 RepID=A0ABT6XJH6_9GAMM|nr:hypothetical protein [Lysobacter sp. LF1]MDI9240108.1 hypothetical protein [Lysobacter sp. LF1]
MTLQELRADFMERRKGCLSLPITGCIVWSLAAIASFVVPHDKANLALIVCYFLLIPISIAIARVRGEQIGGGAQNPLLRLAGQCRLMVTLLWAVHLPLLFLAPEFFPLSMAVGYGLHWIVFSWTVGHPVGLVHALLRTFLVVGGWLLFPGNRVGAVAVGVVIAYLVSVWQLNRLHRQRKTDGSFKPQPLSLRT